MTLSEFKAWFEGYTEGIEGAPTEKQFAKIKDKVADIDGTAVTYPIYVDRYVSAPYQPWPFLTRMGNHNIAYAQGAGTCSVGRGNETIGMSIDSSTGFSTRDFKSAPLLADQPFDSHAAMYALGKAEALAA